MKKEICWICGSLDRGALKKYYLLRWECTGISEKHFQDLRPTQPCNQKVEFCFQLVSSRLLGLHLDPEDGGITSFRNIARLSPRYIVHGQCLEIPKVKTQFIVYVHRPCRFTPLEADSWSICHIHHIQWIDSATDPCSDLRESSPHDPTKFQYPF